MRALRIVAYFVRRGWYLTVGSGRSMVLGIAAIAMALLLWGVVLLLQGNLTRSLGDLGTDLKARAYLGASAGVGDSAEVARLVGDSGVTGTVREVDSEAAAAELARAFPDLGTITDSGSGVVNGYVEWTWRQGIPNEVHDALIGEVRAMSQVEWLDDDRPWRGRMQTAAYRLRIIGLILGVLSVLAAGFVTAAVVRLTAFRHRIEIEVERLAGATELYVRGPFLFAGLLLGAAAAGVAIGLLYAFWSGAEELVGNTVITDLILGTFLSPSMLATLVGVGALAGVAGAAVALRPPRTVG